MEIIHMNGRVYDYNLGRFLSVDPLIQGDGNSQGINPYSYIMNNPLAGTDPTGYKIEQAVVKDEVPKGTTLEGAKGVVINHKTGVATVVYDNGKQASISMNSSSSISGSVVDTMSQAKTNAKTKLSAGGDKRGKPASGVITNKSELKSSDSVEGGQENESSYQKLFGDEGDGFHEAYTKANNELNSAIRLARKNNPGAGQEMGVVIYKNEDGSYTVGTPNIHVPWGQDAGLFGRNDPEMLHSLFGMTMLNTVSDILKRHNAAVMIIGAPVIVKGTYYYRGGYIASGEGNMKRVDIK